jgi:hypothetical protein
VGGGAGGKLPGRSSKKVSMVAALCRYVRVLRYLCHETLVGRRGICSQIHVSFETQDARKEPHLDDSKLCIENAERCRIEKS